MKKYYITAFTLIFLISILLIYIIFTLGNIKNSQKTPNNINNTEKYEIFINNEPFSKHSNFTEATREANLLNNSYIVDLKTGERIWTKNPQFVVVDNSSKSHKFIFYNEAINYAKNLDNAVVYHLNTGSILWDNEELPKSTRLDAPLILQLPELARGCEVTSLAMLLQQANINVDKLQLAREIKKDNTSYEIIDNKVHFGNPHIGFVGDIYTFDNPGYGVYHEPMFDLLSSYLPNRAIDLTKTDFENLLYFISKGYPIVVIINSTYSPLPKNLFETWSTPYGDIDITYHEHSVLITGYDENYIYFNDPLNYKSYANKSDFINAWIQMGSQAITYVNYKN